jgi:hypothetical protein
MKCPCIVCLYMPSIRNTRLEGEDARSSPSPTTTKRMNDQGGQEQTNAKNKLQSVFRSGITPGIGLRQSDSNRNQLLGDYTKQIEDQPSG